MGGLVLLGVSGMVCEDGVEVGIKWLRVIILALSWLDLNSRNVSGSAPLALQIVPTFCHMPQII